MDGGELRSSASESCELSRLRAGEGRGHEVPC